MTNFDATIKPHFEAELKEAEWCNEQRDPAGSFTHLERAHVLGQSSTRLHVTAHWQMLKWAVQNGSVSEFVGQVMRIVGAATKTAIGWVPEGNTGGSNVSPFRRMPMPGDLAAIIERARR